MIGSVSGATAVVTKGVPGGATLRTEDRELSHHAGGKEEAANDTAKHAQGDSKHALN